VVDVSAQRTNAVRRNYDRQILSGNIFARMECFDKLFTFPMTIFEFHSANPHFKASCTDPSANSAIYCRNMTREKPSPSKHPDISSIKLKKIIPVFCIT
jgi:hypothetical protein